MNPLNVILILICYASISFGSNGPIYEYFKDAGNQEITLTKPKSSGLFCRIRKDNPTNENPNPRLIYIPGEVGDIPRELKEKHYVNTEELVLLGSSCFYDAFISIQDAIPIARQIGATHIVFSRFYHDTVDYSYQVTGVSTIHNSASATAYSGGAYAASSSSSTTLAPYSYTKHVHYIRYEHNIYFYRHNVSQD